MVDEKQVWNKLKTVMDPEMQINLVDLGLIYKVTIITEAEQTDYEDWMKRGDLVKILMTLTSPGCPLAGMFDELVGGAVRALPNVGRCQVEITFDPAWSPGMMSDEAKAELGYISLI